ncbi:hypothetical protein RHMOL_Rhmol10G0108900 [Rhododendron molle]|uniref:Uncharacterized protein n=2 Tax=Rhododendron molle TaxID=49168 RepID=A0ACC0M1N8_RHOML|nr:hypothetical protein RHMOL_Rhmol10G0108900 [Rhododendron molle]KAI8534677.1 hypothetical protein RHMOL_Rhmol10G0108900 [Rhododendron molle]
MRFSRLITHPFSLSHAEFIPFEALSVFGPFTSPARLANPTPIIQTFYAEDQIFNDAKLHGVVTLIDSKHGNIHLDDVKPKGLVNEAAKQIAYADRITVNEMWEFYSMVRFRRRKVPRNNKRAIPCELNEVDSTYMRCETK